MSFSGGTPHNLIKRVTAPFLFTCNVLLQAKDAPRLQLKRVQFFGPFGTAETARLLLYP